MPVIVERELERSADKKGFTGERKARYIYGTMNKLGLMEGNKETPKGKAMEKEHEHGHRKAEIAKKMGHSPLHDSRHRRSQMKYFGSDKYAKSAKDSFDNAAWKYARENRMSDKRIF